MPLYQDSYKRPVQLGSQINQGGEGKICRIVGDQSRVAKIWRVPNRERAIKLIATIKNTPVPVSARQNIRYCWPQDVLTDGKNIVGYIMPAVNTNEFRQSQEFFNETLRKDTETTLGVTITEKTLVTAARDLCAAVAEIHAAGHVIGDVNEKNILINSDGTVRIVDIDAIQIYDPETSETHRCTVGRDEYTPPRLQGQSLDLVDRTQDDDCFGLAVMIFKLMMGGRHPFTSRLSRDDDNAITGIDEKIKNEYFPYNQDDTVPDQYKVAVEEYKQAWDNSRDQIRTLFLQTFDPFETRNRPRPTATEWTDELDREIELIEQGKRKQAKPTRTSSPQISGNTADNQAEVQRALNHMQKDLKRLVIAYADRLQQKNVWSANLLPKNAGTVSEINGVADIRACSDTLALLHCLISLSKKLKLAWARDQSLSQGLVSEVKDYRNDEHELDLFDDQYTTRALQAIKKLHDGIKAAPKSLPDTAIWRGANQNQGTNQQPPVPLKTASTKGPYTNPPPTLSQLSPPAKQGPITQQTTSAPARERIPAIVFLAASTVAGLLIAFTITPRISLHDTTLDYIIAAIVIAAICLCWLGKPTKQPVPQRLGNELKAGWALATEAKKLLFQAIGKIQNQKTKRIVSIGLIIVVVTILGGGLIYLFIPNVVAAPPDPNTASTEKAPTSTPIPNNPKDLAPLPATVPNIPLDDASHVQQLSSLVNEYAHCNRAYSDQEAGERAQAIGQFIQPSATTLDEIRRIVHEECPPIRVNDDAAEPSTPQPTTTRALFHQTIPTILPSTDQPSIPNPTAIPDVAIPTVTPAPSPTPSPYNLSTAIKPLHVQQLDADGGLLSSQNYEIAACYYDPHDTEPPRKWKLFTQPDQSLLEPVFTIHFTEPINLQHGLCYEFNVSYMGPTEWRVCASQPYGGNCDHNSSDFLWEREIPAFRGNPDSATYIWTPDPDNR